MISDCEIGLSQMTCFCQSGANDVSDFKGLSVCLNVLVGGGVLKEHVSVH